MISVCPTHREYCNSYNYAWKLEDLQWKIINDNHIFWLPRNNMCPWGDTRTVQVTCSLTHSRSDPGLSCQCVSVFLHTIDPITAPAWYSTQNQRSLWRAFRRYKCEFLGSTRLHFSSSVIQYICCWFSGKLRCQMLPEGRLLNDLKMTMLKYQT